LLEKDQTPVDGDGYELPQWVADEIKRYRLLSDERNKNAWADI
jgi:hypothetical protein